MEIPGKTARRFWAELSAPISGICAEKLKHGTRSSIVLAHSVVFPITCLQIPPIFCSFAAYFRSFFTGTVLQGFALTVAAVLFQSCTGFQKRFKSDHWFKHRISLNVHLNLLLTFSSSPSVSNFLSTLLQRFPAARKHHTHIRTHLRTHTRFWLCAPCLFHPPPPQPHAWLKIYAMRVWVGKKTWGHYNTKRQDRFILSFFGFLVKTSSRLAWASKSLELQKKHGRETIT